jgi:hypothetical protein
MGNLREQPRTLGPEIVQIATADPQTLRH